MRKLWGGVFSEEGDSLLDRFGQSIESDLTFWREDVFGSIAHAGALKDAGVLTAPEHSELVTGLNRILEEGAESLPMDVEDIHTAIEFRLGELVGEVAGKLHTGRSRNDQVATATRLWLRRACVETGLAIKEFQAAVLAQATAHAATPLPGVTHQQHAQPVTLGFHLLAYFFAFQRHGARIQAVARFAGGSPLGSAALAGTPVPVDRWRESDELGFEAPMPNSLDATSERGYVLDALHASVQVMTDLSRFANETVLWSTPEFGFVRLPDSVTTGSSIMPQKRNPDPAELVRGKAGRVLGNYVSVATMMKGLVLGYNRDTQEDKPPLFDSVRTILDCLEVCTLLMKSAEFQAGAMSRAMRADFTTATDLADALAGQGIPFRQAHELAGKIVRHCLEAGTGLEDLSAEDFAAFGVEDPAGMVTKVTIEASLSGRETYGGTGPKSVGNQLRQAESMLKEDGFLSLWPGRD